MKTGYYITLFPDLSILLEAKYGLSAYKDMAINRDATWWEEKQCGREQKYFLTTASLKGGTLNEEKGPNLKITLGLAFKCPQNYKLIKKIRVIEEKRGSIAMPIGTITGLSDYISFTQCMVRPYLYSSLIHYGFLILCKPNHNQESRKKLRMPKTQKPRIWTMT